MWADPGSKHEAALRASGWRYEVPAPGSVEPDEPPATVPTVEPPVVEVAAPEPMLVKPKGQGRAAVGR
jgi:hypothetical protein